MPFRTFFILVLFLFIAVDIFSQLSGYNLMEYQLGNIPTDTNRNLSTHFDQLFVKYRYNKINSFVMVEQFITPDNSKEYLSLSQYQLNYSDNCVKVTIGNFYETIGRGLLLRTYEIKGSVFEDVVQRVRQGFYNDIRGFSAKYSGEIFSLKVLRGRPLFNVIPPTNDPITRRPDLLEAVEGNISFLKQNLGLAYMRDVDEYSSVNYMTFYLSGNLPYNFSYYNEWAQKIGKDNPIGYSAADAVFADYFNLTYSYSSFGASLEFKKYQNFNLGSAFNFPPALVKEHSYRTLNRSIHTPQLDNESGFQSEFYYSFPNHSMITTNFTRLKNNFGKEFIFDEYFIEYYLPADKNSIKIFADYSNDEIVSQKNRYSGGLYYNRELSNSWSTGLEFEYQTFPEKKMTLII